MVCQSCIDNLPSSTKELPDIISLFDYTNELVKKLIWHLKYRNKTSLAKIFAAAIYDRIVPELEELETMNNFENPILVPIPLSKNRLKERGYNQSELLVDELAKLTNLEALVCLEKIKETPTQVSIKNREKRLANLSSCFIPIKIEKIKDRNIFVVDDVTTTGTTIEEARKTLLEAGAKKVLGLTIAH